MLVILQFIEKTRHEGQCHLLVVVVVVVVVVVCVGVGGGSGDCSVRDECE